MNIGEKVLMLKESLGFKNFAEYGKAVGLPGDWLLQLSKKDNVTTIDITRLIKLANYHNINLDELLKDDVKEYIVDIKKDLPDDDIAKIIENIQIKLDNGEVYFNGLIINSDCKSIINDSLEILKGLIKNNL